MSIGDEEARALVKRPTELSTRQDMDLDQARTILGRLVHINEAGVTDMSDSIEGLSSEEIRLALKAVGNCLMAEAHAKENKFGTRSVQKVTPQGERELAFISSGQTTETRGVVRDWVLTLNLDLPDIKGASIAPGIGITYPLIPDPTNKLQSAMTAYHDTREDRAASALNLMEDSNIEDYRFMLKGLRWMAHTMLHWEEPETLLPEQLPN